MRQFLIEPLGRNQKLRLVMLKRDVCKHNINTQKTSPCKLQWLVVIILTSILLHYIEATLAKLIV